MFAGRPPTTLFDIKPGRKTPYYLPEDYLLVKALYIHESSLCPDCHSPAAWAFNPRLERYFYEDDSVTCTPCKIRETRAADQQDKLRPGEKIVIGNLIVEPELLEASGR